MRLDLGRPIESIPILGQFLSFVLNEEINKEYYNSLFASRPFAFRFFRRQLLSCLKEGNAF